MEARTLTLAVLVSGVGTTLDGIAQRIQEGRLPARIGMVIADRPRIPALERAARRGLASKVVWRRSTSPAEWSRALLTVLEPTHPDLIVLAGFLSILPPEFLAHYRGRIINVHPSLLPKYGGRGMYGAKVHQAVLDAHDTETGATVHLVTDAL
ncbi:MAG: phosphoribosylglycinamide formyltransferase, partial [Thermoplasmata archaeon]|nr:phosphoribosylglycinamide formyltransferase [Thermoplasmata archaeon]